MVQELERYSPEIEGRIAFEHLHRYHFCKDIVAGKVVLDIACGEGYGARVLAATANNVLGADRDAVTIKRAREKYGHIGNLAFEIADCEIIPFDDRSFDVVVSFETIEHIFGQARFLLEVARVLKPNGVLVISTPNRATYTDASGQINNFHVRELYESEFREMLGSLFKYVQMCGQRFFLPSIISEIRSAESGVKFAASSPPELLIKSGSLDLAGSGLTVREAQYFVAVCGNGDILVSQRSPSIYLDETNDLWIEQERLLRWASGLHEEDERLRQSLRESEVRLKRLTEGQEAKKDDAYPTLMDGGAHFVHSYPSSGSTTSNAIRDHEADERERLRGDLSKALAESIEAEDRARQAECSVRSSNAERLALEKALLEARRDLKHSTADFARISDELIRLKSDVELSDAQATKLRDERDRLFALHEKSNAKASRYEARTIRTRELLDTWSAAARANDELLLEIKRKVAAAGVRTVTLQQLANASKKIRPILCRDMLRFASPRRDVDGLSGTAATEDVEWLRAQLDQSGLFDPLWYRSQNADIAESGADPLAHFVENGCWEGRNPHPLFDGDWYRMSNALPLTDEAPFVNYLRSDQRSRLSTHPLFNPDFYLEANEDVRADGVDPLEHFIRHGGREGRNPHPLVSLDRLAVQSGFEQSTNPLVDYLSKSELFLSNPHSLFDGEFYLYENQDVERGGINPLAHYCSVGWREGRLPHRLFAGDWYLVTYSDVARSGLNPLEHYVRYGAREGRRPHPLFDPIYYCEKNTGFRSGAHDAFSHYIETGSQACPETTPLISAEDMRAIVPPGYLLSLDLISAFLYYGRNELNVPALHTAAARRRLQNNIVVPPLLSEYLTDRFGQTDTSRCAWLMSSIAGFALNRNSVPTMKVMDPLIDRLETLTERLDRPSNPDVSIIIPVHNNCIFTLCCVISIVQNPSRFSYEILIGDDASTDETQSIFTEVGGPVRHIANSKSLGFIGNCNACAATSQARFLVFLNNDTLTLPGWLDELIQPIVDDARIGFAGSKLINADGTLQEAGGILWSDGSAWNFGRNGHPNSPEFNYLKDVDYVSGASIALPRDIWLRLEGFDTHFSPAYCEDSDIAFRVRESGLRSIYCPRSAVIHYEGMSHGSDTNQGIKAYQIANQRKLFDRWAETLGRENFRNGENVFLARDRSRGKPHILVVDHYIPQWDRDAGSRTMFHFLRMFAASGFHVVFWSDNYYEDREYCGLLQNLGIEVIYSPAYVDRFDDFMRQNGRFFQAALVSRPHIAIKYYEAIRAHSECVVLYYGHDVHFLRMMMEYDLNGGDDLAAAIDEMRLLEEENWDRSDVVLYPSVEEREYVRQARPDCVVDQVPMLGYTPRELRLGRTSLDHFAARNADDLVFVGGAHPPNVAALTWFVSEVLPAVVAMRPETKLHIVGSVTGGLESDFASDSIVWRGRLSDDELRDLYATAGVAIIPLRFGGGVKGKTIEALFHGIPLVATPVGMQGLAPTEPIGLVAWEAIDFADAILNAQSDRAGARERTVRGLEFIDSHYSIEAMRRTFAGYLPVLNELPQLEMAEGALH